MRKLKKKEVLLYNPETELGTYHGSFTVPFSGGHLSEHITIQLLENQQVIHTAFIESSGMAIFKNGTYLVSQENILVHLTQFIQKRFDDTSGVILADTIEDNTIDEKMVFKLQGDQLILAVDSSTYTFTRYSGFINSSTVLNVENPIAKAKNEEEQFLNLL